MLEYYHKTNSHLVAESFVTVNHFTYSLNPSVISQRLRLISILSSPPPILCTSIAMFL